MMRKLQMMMTAVLAVFCGLALIACSDNIDNPVVPSAEDNGTWTLDEAKDLTVSAGDDFYQYCNGTWVAQATIDPTVNPDVTGFFYTELPLNVSSKNIAVEKPNMLKFSNDVLAAPGNNIERTEAVLQEAADMVNAATTREQLWDVMAELTERGYQVPLIIIAVPLGGRMTGVVQGMDQELKKPGASRFHSVERINELINEVRRPAKAAVTRAVSSEEWPMVTHICGKLGIAPDDIVVGGLDSSAEALEALKELQDCTADELRELLLSYIYNDREAYSGYASGMVAFQLMNSYRVYLNYEVSYRFAQTYVTDANRQRGIDMCEQLRQAFRERIAANGWLSEGSKTNALRKLNQMNMFVGAPEEFFTEGLPDFLSQQSLAEDLIELRRAFRALQLRLTGKSIAEGAFHFVASTASNLAEPNAFYMPTANSLFILPIWLLSPIYEEGANSAYNFATLCCIIGHEMTHGFDTTGSQYDENGSMASLWTSDADAQAFNQLADALMQQHSAVEVAPGVFANGKKTIAEDLADLGGFEIAFQAYTNYLKANGFSGEGLRLQQRRFYEAFAYFWRAKYTDAFIVSQVADDSDEHSLARERVNGVVTNTDAWYDLFDVQPGQKLYRPTKERVKIW